MAESAQLGTNHFISSGLNWGEPDWDQRTRDRIPRDPHFRHEKIVDHVFRGKLCNNRAVDRHMKFARRNDVILASRIIWINASGFEFETKLTSRRPNCPSA